MLLSREQKKNVWKTSKLEFYENFVFRNTNITYLWVFYQVIIAGINEGPDKGGRNRMEGEERKRVGLHKEYIMVQIKYDEKQWENKKGTM